MAQINSSDVTMSVFPQTEAGTLPTTGSRYELPISVNAQLPVFVSNDVTSDTKRPGRAANGTKPGMVTGTGSIPMRLQVAPVFQILIESAISGKFDNKVAKAGTDDSTFALVGVLDDGPSGSALVEGAIDCMASKLTIAGKFGEGITFNLDYFSIKPYRSTTKPALSVTAVPASASEFVASDEGSISIAGLDDFTPTAFTLEITQERVAQGQLFSNAPRGIATSGTRSVKLMITGYREDFGPETGVTGVKQNVALTLGDTGAGWTFALPAATGVRPRTSLDGESAMVELEFTAAFDSTAGTDLIVTQL